MRTVHISDSEGAQHVCVDCLIAWSDNGLGAGTQFVELSDEPCENCDTLFATEPDYERTDTPGSADGTTAEDVAEWFATYEEDEED